MLSKIGDRYCTKEIGIGAVEVRETCQKYVFKRCGTNVLRT